MPETVLIFANPIAGRGQGKTVARRLERDLLAAGYAVRTFFDRPADIPAKSLEDPANTVIIIGGDGTLRAVVELLFSHDANCPPLLPVPMGTANLMGRHLGMRWSRHALGPAVLATIRRRKILDFDVARANGKVFLLMAGVGIDGQVVHLLDRMRTGPINLASYVMPAASTLLGYTFPAITVTVDDRVIARDVPAVAFIGNVKEYGIGFPILTEARADDGLLDVCVIPCRNRQELAEILLAVAAGEHTRREGVVYVKGRHIHVDSAVPVPVQVDGDPAGHTPLEIDLLPRRARFLVPT